MSNPDERIDGSKIMVKLNKYNHLKDDEYLFVSPDEATLDIITELLTNAEVDYIAVKQESISQNECHIVYHCPEFINLARFEPHSEKANEFESVVIRNQKYALKLTEIENRDTDNRIVLYDEAEQNLRDDDHVGPEGEFHE